ncbi:MAG TPA: glutamate 5-kinase [Clostridiales bacterium]|jgi:glutamate 5-kinase|nr:glutamate 5-kinase [Clostridiales bacterium]
MRIVVKVGTSNIIRKNGSIDIHSMDLLARTISDIKNMGNEIILVSSGAIGVGTNKLGLPERPRELRMKQAVASVGQCELMHLYDKLFSEYGQTVGQILLTGGDVERKTSAEHLTRTFEALLELGAIPIVNENDSVSSAEIETGKDKVLGDNDTLSSIVAVLCSADLLVILSDIDGLYDKDPNCHPDARLIPVVYEITDDLRHACGDAGEWGTGGMLTKLDAAMRAMQNGIDMIITNGSKIENLYKIAQEEPVGTRFVSMKKKEAVSL